MYVADNICNELDGITNQTPKPRPTLWRLRCDERLIELRPCLIRRGGMLVVVVVVVVVIVTIQTIAIQVLLVDPSTCGDDVGGADVDNMGETHDVIVGMIEHNVTLDKQSLQLFHSSHIV